MQNIQEWIEKLEHIPTLPVVAMKVSELINDPRSSGQEIADFIRKDQALTAKILRLVNSSYYSIPGGVTDVQRALAYLGFNTVAQIVLGLSVVGLFKPKNESVFSLEAFWKHAIAVAVISEELGKALNYKKPEELFTCGLLHDIGKLVLHELDPERLYAISKKAADGGLSFIEVERTLNLPGHAFLGEQMAARWGLPSLIRVAIHYHHHNVWEMDSLLAGEKTVAHIVALANQVAVLEKIGYSGNASVPTIVPEHWLTPLDLSPSAFKSIIESSKTKIDMAGAFLNA